MFSGATRLKFLGVVEHYRLIANFERSERKRGGGGKREGRRGCNR